MDTYLGDFPRLWLLSTQSSSHIHPLHYSQIRSRRVFLTEDPRLHLLWMHDRVFIKPLPTYLLSYNFWAVFLVPPTSPLGSRRDDVHKAVLGFVRTYVHLIQYESDFRIAVELHLLPEGIQWEQFARFQNFLSSIQDRDVSQRYLYGEIRLTRLNFWTKVFLQKWEYEPMHKQYSDWFSRFYEPLLFTFAILFLALNAMQVAIAVDQISSSGWTSFWSVCRWFSVLTILLAASLVLAFLSILSSMILREFIFAWKDKIRMARAGKAT
ncbi:hypothetical protein K458DRAFT_442509 [Lentithecium fluviatile CBS 122367]|uniref:Uncharacterized protein n=1 Tax=Lentithecium fluviatile CBS 122367 TaxID=1168545 RepID=A0A6G1J2C1_9PLEO|nr:hypothetical protein K458DRAFT_442509 [Lentithecium fluviatile CBS 122367]